VEGCKQARSNDVSGVRGDDRKKGGFPRKDNLRRHLRRHGIGDEKKVEGDMVLGDG
jgi:hypothetical protein